MFRFSFLRPEDYTAEAQQRRLFQNLPFNTPGNSDNSDPNASPLANQTPPKDDPTPDFMSAYSDLLKGTDGPAMAAYRKYLDTGYPDEKDYQPSGMRRIGAILSGVGAGLANPAEGFKVTHDILDEPFKGAKERFDAEGQRLEKGAALEEAGNQKKINTLNSLRDTQYKIGELSRQNLLTSSQVEKNLAQAKAAGMKLIKNDLDGHYYSVSPDGNKIDLGTFDKTSDQKQEDAIKKAYGIASVTSPIIEGREKRVGAAASANTLNNEKTMADINAANTLDREKTMADYNANIWQGKEDTRQTNRTMLQTQKGQQQLDRDIAKAGVTGNHLQVAARIRDNRDKTDALALADPNKFGKYWVQNSSTGYKELTPPPDMAKDPQGYNNWVQVYNTLYNGAKQLSPQEVKAPPSQGKGGQTPSGNVRRKQ